MRQIEVRNGLEVIMTLRLIDGVINCVYMHRVIVDIIGDVIGRSDR